MRSSGTSPTRWRTRGATSSNSSPSLPTPLNNVNWSFASRYRRRRAKDRPCNVVGKRQQALKHAVPDRAGMCSICSFSVWAPFSCVRFGFFLHSLLLFLIALHGVANDHQIITSLRENGEHTAISDPVEEHKSSWMTRLLNNCVVRLR